MVIRTSAFLVKKSCGFIERLTESQLDNYYHILTNHDYNEENIIYFLRIFIVFSENCKSDTRFGLKSLISQLVETPDQFCQVLKNIAKKDKIVGKYLDEKILEFGEKSIITALQTQLVFNHKEVKIYLSNLYIFFYNILFSLSTK